MKFPRTYALKDIASIINADYRGADDFPVEGMNEIHMVESGDIVFVDHPKYYKKALESAASIVLINQDVECPEGKALLLSDDPFRDFNRLAQFFQPVRPTINAIDASSSIGKGTILQHNVTIGADVHIGENCLIGPNVVILAGCEIGDRVIIQANTVIGSDAFYYKKRPDGYDRLLSTGKVIIEDDTEIGASCTIDRGVSGATRIGRGSKFDNQVHIGHDVVIGPHALFAAQVGVAGCVTIGEYVTLWGQVGLVSGITIGDRVAVLGQAGVSKSLESGKTYFGTPAEESRKKFRELASIRILPEVIEHLNLT